MPDLRSLETFYWVARLGSFRGAAERLNTTQPAVSLRIANLEREFDARLLDRGSRTASLTPRGRLLLEYAERFLALRAEMMASVAEGSALSGVLRLGVSETIVHTWLSRFIERVHAAHPRITLDIDVDVSPALRNALVEHELDLAFLLGPVSEPTVNNLDLSRYPLAFLASPHLDLGPGPVPVERLLEYPVITYPKATRPYLALRQMLARPDRPPPRIFSNSSLSTIVRMTLDGIGVSVITPVAVAEELARGRLAVVPVDLLLPDLVFTASYAAGPHGASAEPLARLARDVAAKFDHKGS